MEELGIRRGAITAAAREGGLEADVYHGITVGGVPVGGPGFAEEYVHQLTGRYESYIRHIVTQLRTPSAYAAWACIQRAGQTRMDYWLQHLPPSVMEAAADRVDAVVVESVEALTYEGAMAPEEALVRLRLPVRRRGCGMRSRRWLSPIAYCTSFRTAAEQFLSSRTADGTRTVGFFPQLSELFGPMSFDYDTPDLRLTRFMRSGTATAAACEAGWTEVQMRAEGVIDIASGPLSHPFATLPAQHQLQRAVTHQCEAAMARQADALLLALPREDARRAAWLEAADGAQIAGRWLAAHPCERLGMTCSSAEFSEALVSYFGIESPAARAPGTLGR